MLFSRTKMMVAALAAAALSAGCGPSPAFMAEPKAPVAYEPAPGPEPTPSDLLAKTQQEQPQDEARSEQSQPFQPQEGDVALGVDADEYSDTDPSALTQWKPVLENHGTWVDDSTYGTVWVPSQSEVGADFQPYVTAGRWTYSDTESWVWVSDYDWGWVPFHYGRWVHLPGHGWTWIPGRRYAGAWVVWRTGPLGYEYVGWAPAPPDWYWYNGVAIGWTFGWHHPHYVYCPHTHIHRPVVASYVIRGGTPAAAPIEARTQPYRPATPSVAGGRVVAQPGVAGGGRVVAQPGVREGRVTASPSVGGRVIASPPVGDREARPTPGELGIKQGVAPPPSGDAKLARAQAFASPATAKPLGAAAPSLPRPRPVEPSIALGAPPQRMSSSVSSRFDPVARSPQFQGVAPRPSFTPSRPVTDPAPFSARPSTAPPLVDHWSRPSSPSISSQPTAPSFRPSPSIPSHATSPSFRPSPSIPSQPTSPSFRPSPSISSQPTSPSFRPSPSIPSQAMAPSFRPSSPSISSTRSTPSFRPSTPSVSAPMPRPSVRSFSPSVSAPSRASPSINRAAPRRR